MNNNASLDKINGITDKQVIKKHSQQINFLYGQKNSKIIINNVTVVLKKIEFGDVKPIATYAFFYFPIQQHYTPILNFEHNDTITKNLMMLKQITSKYGVIVTKEELNKY